MTPTPTLDIATVLPLANRLADAARAAILPHFRNPGLGAENKDPDAFDPVTQADRAAEAAMRAILDSERPDDGILGEEYGQKTGTSGLEWVLDPIDGTRGFISGTPTWGVLIALSDVSGPRFGMIDQPYIGERFVGGLGESFLARDGARRPLRVNPAATLADAKILTTFPEVGTETEGAAFHALASRCKLTRYGMDCYGYALLAAGQVDLVVEAGLAPYDIHAPIAVVQAAGGIVTDWTGGPAHPGGRALAAASRALHAEALQIVQAATGPT